MLFRSVSRTPEDYLLGVGAVVDKDAASRLLANALGAELLIISTAVDKVSLHFGTPAQKKLGTVQVDEMECYLNEGHFPPGSMGPKVQSAVDFLRNGGREVIITNPENLSGALLGNAGTRITK